MREILLEEAMRRVRRVLEVGHTGANPVEGNPEKAQFIAPTGGFATFRIVADPLGLRSIGRG
ncbi:MAG: hypothetical protein BWY43_00787 [candidate division WS2 bacterium ADurb.Bin280]|uniref:Uncharacterized protein n=1 Tax=candidate division WS2 bacterium ADurb.Bin280 TaxID=1852829 RepID=A0A1V5SBI4_9BACT|nr:MAG: hypothetical protein BWY43_00787 [candidate division WS2 bacterium ADurb.Bin280]